MDGETKTLLLVLAVFAIGATAGWCIKQDLRRARRTPGTTTLGPAVGDAQGAAAKPMRGGVGFAAIGQPDCACKGN